MNEPTKDAASIQRTLIAARAGGSSVHDLARAHELAEKHGLQASIIELRRHIHAHVPNPDDDRIPVAKTIVLGILTGIVTNYMLVAMRMKASIRRLAP